MNKVGLMKYIVYSQGALIFYKFTQIQDILGTNNIEYIYITH